LSPKIKKRQDNSLIAMLVFKLIFFLQHESGGGLFRSNQKAIKITSTIESRAEPATSIPFCGLGLRI
jgi:hypothetical protein